MKQMLMLIASLCITCAALAVEPGVDYARPGQVQYVSHTAAVCRQGEPCAQVQPQYRASVARRRGLFRRGCGG